jgi:ketosteroid isomerase-like protein
MSQRTHFATPEDAEQAFYEALAKGDTDALMAIWAEDEEILCVHPTGVQILGLGPIRESWRNIFDNAKLRVQAEPVAHWQGMLLSIHHLVETLFVGDDPAPHGPLHVTHVYSRGAHGWRLVSRHASAAGDTPAVSDATPRVLH